MMSVEIARVPVTDLCLQLDVHNLNVINKLIDFHCRVGSTRVIGAL